MTRQRRVSGTASALLADHQGSALIAVAAHALGRQLHRDLLVSEAVLTIPTANRGARGNWSQVANVATEIPLRLRVAEPADSVATIQARFEQGLEYAEIPIARLVELFPTPVPSAADGSSAAHISGGDHPRISINLLRSGNRIVLESDELIVRIADDLLPEEVGWASGLTLEMWVGDDIELRAVYSPAQFDDVMVDSVLTAVADALRKPDLVGGHPARPISSPEPVARPSSDPRPANHSRKDCRR